jgi:hypothetical protein
MLRQRLSAVLQVMKISKCRIPPLYVLKSMEELPRFSASQLI